MSLKKKKKKSNILSDVWKFKHKANGYVQPMQQETIPQPLEHKKFYLYK